MSYIIKKTDQLVNLKLTDIGRQNLSNGRLTFNLFALGDGEMDYTNALSNSINILRPVDSQHDILYPIANINNTYKTNISQLISHKNEINQPSVERGFFNYTGTPSELRTELCLITNLMGTITGVTDELYVTTTNDTVINNYDSNIKKHDYLWVEFYTTGVTSDYTIDITGITQPEIPVPQLMYVIQSVNDVESTPTTGVTGSTYNIFKLKLDRNLPNFIGCVVKCYVYSGKDTIRDYYDNPTPLAYWSEGLLNFTNNCPLSEDDVPVWNMNIVLIEDFIGLDGLNYKGKNDTSSNAYMGTAINYKYLTDSTTKKIGIIHYTNNTVNNFYGEGFYRDTLKLKIPYLMWHKKQFTGVGTATSVGYTFICGNTLKYIAPDVKYYDLIDQEEIYTVVGKVLVDQKIIIIEHPELLTALSYKSNRNWTLPKPTLSLIEVGLCPSSSTVGTLRKDESLHVSYLLTDSNGLSSLHCENFTTITNETDEPRDVLFRFPFDNSVDTNYNEFAYLMDYDKIDGYGFKTNNIILLLQKTPNTSDPNPEDWRYFNVNNYVGTDGCVEAVTELCNKFELYTESTIYPTDFINNTYELSQNEIGGVIVSINGVIQKSASSALNVGVDGDYYQYPKTEKVGLNGRTVVGLNSIILTTGGVIQFHYLVGQTQSASTIKEDYQIPLSGVPVTNTHQDGVYISGTNVNLALTYQPNSGVVYVFYNSTLISSNNYNVHFTGTTLNRSVELLFTPSVGSLLSVFYLDNSGASVNPQDTKFTASKINNLKVHIGKDIMDASENNIYDINDYISIPNDINNYTFGDEGFFFGNIETNIKATIYKSIMTCNVLPNRFINSDNPTFNPNGDKVAFTEIGIYDEDEDLVAIGKFNSPIQRKYNSDMLIIQATIQF